MIEKVIVLSGPVGAGKSDLSTALRERFGCHVCKTHEYIRKLKGAALERQALQVAGERLDKESGGAWLGGEVSKDAVALTGISVLVVDAVRIKGQLAGLRRAFDERVTHIHLTASREELARRYAGRVTKVKELTSYQEVLRDRTEAQVETLRDIADISIDTELCEPADVLSRVASRLGLYGRGDNRLVDVLVGGQYGSEGKGQVVAHLAPDYELLIRVGGPNAGHKVYAEPKPYTFRTVPSGAQRAEDARLAIGPGAVINMGVLQREISECALSVDRLFIDPLAMIIETWDEESEVALKKALGSTGQGVGFATARKVLRDHFPGKNTPKVRLAQDMAAIRHFIRPTREVLDDAYRLQWRVLLEGTQGTGLSIYHGDYPKVTSRDTTASGCLSEAGISPLRVRRIIMVCRTYPIRVGGNSGPMGREISWATVAKRSGLSKRVLEDNERGSVSGNLRRVAEFSWAQLRRSATLNAPTDIAITFADYISKHNQEARRYDQLTTDTALFIEEVERVARAPVSLIATRFDYRSIIDRRHW